MSDYLFLSIRPEFVDKIITAQKTVEFRRTRPRAREGHPVILYASSPVMAIMGVAVVRRITSSSPTGIWKMFSTSGGIPRDRFREYYRGATRGHAIELCRVRKLEVPVDLDLIRTELPGFRPPQAFSYLSLLEVACLGLAYYGLVANLLDQRRSQTRHGTRPRSSPALPRTAAESQ